MLHVGLDLSRRRLDFHALDERGETIAVDAVVPDADGLHHLSARFGSQAVRAAIESMNGARFVHDQLELAGWEVEIADAARVKGLAPSPARPTGSTPGCWPWPCSSGCRCPSPGVQAWRRACA